MELSRTNLFSNKHNRINNSLRLEGMHEGTLGDNLTLLVTAMKFRIRIRTEDRTHSRDKSIELSLQLARARLCIAFFGISSQINRFGDGSAKGVGLSFLHVLICPAALERSLQETSLRLEAELFHKLIMAIVMILINKEEKRRNEKKRKGDICFIVKDFIISS